MAKTEKQDRRTRRTERNLREALHSLILEKGYDAVTVQDITDRADVGRSTFYAHFDNKDKLHLSAFDAVRDSMLPNIEAIDTSSNIGGGFKINTLPLFRHAAEHRRMRRALASKASCDLFLKNIFFQVREMCLKELQNSISDERKDSPETKAAAHFYASSLVSMLNFWFDNNLQLSPEEMDELFGRLVLRGVNNLPHLQSDKTSG
ncbi:MAG TPA: TetR/AcrR family transcriptional regulator [Pyrinomonadaceae bacterium]|nr:TetR/AcrR family transcriptional regulator [Pyrinomonadaceae bacterium]